MLIKSCFMIFISLVGIALLIYIKISLRNNAKMKGEEMTRKEIIKSVIDELTDEQVNDLFMMISKYIYKKDKKIKIKMYEISPNVVLGTEV